MDSKTEAEGHGVDATRFMDEADMTCLEEEEEEFEDSDTMFGFDIPKGVTKGVTMKVQAPDGVYLHIPMPDGVYPGDRMCMQKDVATGKWGLKYIQQQETPAVEVKEKKEVLSYTDAQLAKDLMSANICTVSLNTTKGAIRLRIVPAWAPKGVQRFLQLVTNKFYTDVAIYRAVPGFLVQFGVVSDAERKDRYEAIPDDLVRGIPVQDGMVCFAAAGPDTRTAAICIFLGSFPQLGRNAWETPIGKVAPESMAVLRNIFTGYGDMPQCGGTGPDPILLEEQGNDYITENFPACDFVQSAEWLPN